MLAGVAVEFWGTSCAIHAKRFDGAELALLGHLREQPFAMQRRR
jgi:hypothetical protein